jgi:hypothetical protein
MWVPIGDDWFLGKGINANIDGTFGVDLELSDNPRKFLNSKKYIFFHFYIKDRIGRVMS